MNKKMMKAAMAVTVAVVAGCIGYMGYMNQTKVVMSDIMRANVEALANEEWPTITNCKGANIYAEVSIINTVKAVRTHVYDNLDRVVTYKIAKCVAVGHGWLEGMNSIIRCEPLDSGVLVDCRPNEHNSLYD